jgi:hypothetical protein
VESWVNQPDVLPDKRFVYYLLAAKGICVVPISSFCSDLRGFRVTLLEDNEELLTSTFTSISEAIEEYIEKLNKLLKAGKQICAKSTKPLKISRSTGVCVPGVGLEPTRPQWPQDFKSCVSTNSTIRASTSY